MTNIKDRIELSKLLIAHDCMEAIHEATLLMQRLNSHHDDALYRALHDTVVSSYGRAFTEIQPLGRLPKKYSQFDNQADMLRIHKMLMFFRNKSVGHTDFIEGRVRVHRTNNVEVMGESGPAFRYSVSGHTFAPSEIVNVQKTAGWVAGTLQADIGICSERIFGEGFHDLSTDQEDLISIEELEGLRRVLAQKRRFKDDKLS